MIELVISIDGMMCGMCESHVNDIVRQNFKVKSVRSSHKTGQTNIVCEDSIDRERLVEKIESLGYKVDGIIEKSYVKKGLFAKLFKK